MKRIVQSLLKPFGLRLARLDATQRRGYGLDLLLPLLLRGGFAPKHIIDIGANHGGWTRKAIHYSPDAEYTLVEPQEGLERHVQNLVVRGHKIQWIHAGVGNIAGTFPFFPSNRDDSSSFLSSRAQAQPGQTNPVLMQVRTLNEIVSSSRKPVPDLVKIDAEGFDLKALAGASDLLGKTEVFLVEAAVCCADYENTVLNVVQFMASVQYRLIDIAALDRSPKSDALWVCELAFLRNASTILETVNTFE